MTDPFVHLHVASGYSLRHGASHPAVLVERAAEHGMDTLALTDRDGAYGVVKFAKACASAGVRPVFGVDLAVAPVVLDPAARERRPERSAPGRSSPARGGAFLDQDPDRGVEALPRGRAAVPQDPERGSARAVEPEDSLPSDVPPARVYVTKEPPPPIAERPSGDDDGALEPASLQFVRQTLDGARARDDSLETREVELPAIGPHRSG